MKTLVLSMISIAATVAAMTACTSESDPINDITNPKDAKVEIKLNAGVVNVETKTGPTNESEATKFGENITIQLLRWDNSESTLSTIDWASTQSKAASVTGNTITLDDAHKYYDKDNKNAFFIGFYPAEGANVTRTEGTVKYSGIDGTIDILSAQLINAGNKTSGATARNIEFKHMLSQVKIKLAGDAVAKNTFGKITSVTIKDIPKNLDLSLGDGTTIPSIAPNSTPEKADISLLKTSDSSFDLTTEGKTYTTMIVPTFGSTTDKLTIKIETEKFSGENALKVEVSDITNGMNPGTTNNINLTFKDRVNVTTSIVDWVAGDENNKDVDF